MREGILRHFSEKKLCKLETCKSCFYHDAKINFHKRESKAEDFLFCFDVYAFLHKSNISRYQVISAGKVQLAMHSNRL